MVRFVENSLSSNQLNISLADIPCVLENAVDGATQSTPVILYITVNITPPYNSPPSTPRVPTEVDDSPAEEATIQGPIQSHVPERPLPPLHHQPVKTGSTVPQSREEMSPTSTKNPLHRADEAMKRIVPIDRSNTWEGAVRRIKWVMDTLGPIAEVRVMPF